MQTLASILLRLETLDSNMIECSIISKLATFSIDLTFFSFRDFSVWCSLHKFAFSLPVTVIAHFRTLNSQIRNEP